MKFNFNVKKDGTMKIVLDKAAQSVVRKEKKGSSPLNNLEVAFLSVLKVSAGAMKNITKVTHEEVKNEG